MKLDSADILALGCAWWIVSVIGLMLFVAIGSVFRAEWLPFAWMAVWFAVYVDLRVRIARIRKAQRDGE